MDGRRRDAAGNEVTEELVDRAMETMYCPVCGIHLDAPEDPSYEPALRNIWRHHLTVVHPETE